MISPNREKRRKIREEKRNKREKNRDSERERWFTIGLVDAWKVDASDELDLWWDGWVVWTGLNAELVKTILEDGLRDEREKNKKKK